MSNITIPSSNLELININQIQNLAVVGSSAIIKLKYGESLKIDVIPGSLLPSDTNSTEDEEIYVKNHTFNLCNVDSKLINKLQIIKNGLWIAIYSDEKNNKRISGSLNFPLSFNYSVNAGIAKCKLYGNDTIPDAFISL